MDSEHCGKHDHFVDECMNCQNTCNEGVDWNRLDSALMPGDLEETMERIHRLTLEEIYKMEDENQILSPRMKELKELLKEQEVKEAQKLMGKI